MINPFKELKTGKVIHFLQGLIFYDIAKMFGYARKQDRLSMDGRFKKWVFLNAEM